MDETQLNKANRLNKEIRNLEHFLEFYIRSPRQNKLAVKFQKHKFSIKRLGWATIESEEYNLDEETEYQVERILFNRLKEMKTELENI